MAKSDIIATISSRIASATSATPADELATLKFIGTKLGLDTSNVTIQANTASNTASSKDLYDVALLNQAIDAYTNVSMVGDVRPMSSLLPNILTHTDGSTWIKQGFYETDPTKVNKELFPYAVVGSAPTNTGLSTFIPASNTITGETVRLNSGKHISFGYGGFSAAVTCFNDPAVAGTVLNAAISVDDYSYDSTTDTLYLLIAGGLLYKITNDGTVITSFTTTNYGFLAGNSRSVLARNGVVYVGGLNKIRKSLDGGSNWVDDVFTGITADFYVYRMAYVESTNTMVVLTKLSSAAPSRTLAEAFSLFTSIAGANYVARTAPTFNGFPHTIINFKDNLILVSEYTNGTTSEQTLHCMYQGTNTFTSIFSRSISGGTGFRPKAVIGSTKSFIIVGNQLTAAEYRLMAYDIVNGVLTNTITYLSSTYIPADTNAGIGRSSITIFNESLYLKTESVGTYRKLPLYGFNGDASTPHSFLRIK